MEAPSEAPAALKCGVAAMERRLARLAAHLRPPARGGAEPVARPARGSTTTNFTRDDGRLTPAGHAFFETFGYLHFPGLLNDRIGAIIDAFEGVWAAHGGGHHGQPHDYERRSCILPFPDQSAELSSLLDDPRVAGPVASLLGEDFNYTSGDGNLYVGDTNWCLPSLPTPLPTPPHHPWPLQPPAGTQTATAEDTRRIWRVAGTSA